MINSHIPTIESPEPSVYQIKLEGQLGQQWADWFDGANITPKETGDTVLTCTVMDQAALHGLLKKVRDLGMTLISVLRVKPGQGDASESKV